MSKDPWVRALVIVTLAITTLYLVGTLWHVASEFADIILLFFLAWMLAFIIEPTAAPLHERAHLPRTAAIALTYLGLLLLLVFGGLLLVPPLTVQVVQISTNLPGYADQLNRDVLNLLLSLEEQGIHLNLSTMLQPDDIVRRAEAAGPPLLANALGLATGVANLLFQTVLVVMLSFYFALDGRRFTSFIVAALPARFRDDGHYFFDSVNRAFAGFLRGQVLLALVYALGTGAIMRIFDLPYGLLSSVLAGLLDAHSISGSVPCYCRADGHHTPGSTGRCRIRFRRIARVAASGIQRDRTKSHEPVGWPSPVDRFFRCPCGSSACWCSGVRCSVCQLLPSSAP